MDDYAPVMPTGGDPAARAATMMLRFSIQFSSIALLYYDYSLTWTQEVKYFWTKKFTLSTALYFACRYSLLANVIYLLALAGKLPTSCDTGYQFVGWLSVIGRAAIVIVWVPERFTVILLAIMHVPYIACEGHKSKPPIPESVLAIFTVVYEIFSTVCTTARSYQALQLGRNLIDYQKQSHLSLDQTSFVTSFCTAAVFFQFLGAPGSFVQRFLNALNIPISGMMTARFLIHLRDWETGSARKNDVPASPSSEEIDALFKKASKGSGWDVIDEFGVDPVLEATQANRDSRVFTGSMSAGPSTSMRQRTPHSAVTIPTDFPDLER